MSVDCPDTLEAFSDDDSAHLVTSHNTLLRKELFLLFTLDLPCHVFVYDPLIYHPVALQRVWLCLFITALKVT